MPDKDLVLWHHLSLGLLAHSPNNDFLLKLGQIGQNIVYSQTLKSAILLLKLKKQPKIKNHLDRILANAGSNSEIKLYQESITNFNALIKVLDKGDLIEKNLAKESDKIKLHFIKEIKNIDWDYIATWYLASIIHKTTPSPMITNIRTKAFKAFILKEKNLGDHHGFLLRFQNPMKKQQRLIEDAGLIR